MEKIRAESNVRPFEPAVRAARAVQVALLVEFLLGAYLLLATRGWQAYALLGICLLLGGFLAWVENQFRRGDAQSWHRWAVPGALWFAATAFTLLSSGLWLAYLLAAAVITIGVAALLFERSRAAAPMLAAIPALLPVPIIEFLLRPTFRLVIPGALIPVIPYFVGAATLASLVFLALHFSYLSLQQKLIVSFLLLGLLPLATVRSIYDTAFRAALTDAARQNLSSVAAQTASQIDSFINKNMEIVTVQSQLPAFQRLLEASPDYPDYDTLKDEASAQLYNLREIYGQDADEEEDAFLINNFLINREGIVILDTSVPQGQPNPAIGADLSVDPIFVNAALIGLPYASPVRVVGGMESARIYFAKRLTNAENQPIGVYVAAYDALFLQSILAENVGLAGEDSYGAVFDENRMVLAHGEQPDLVYESLEPLPADLVSDLVESGRLPAGPNPISDIGFPELADKLRNSAREPIFIVNDITEGEGIIDQVATARMVNYPWRVAFFQPEAILLEPVNALSTNTLLLAAVLAAAAVVIALLASNQLAGPVLKLTSAAEEVSAGNLGVQADVITHDEVGTLAQTFNSMTRQLQETLGGLEDLVAERTSRLEATNEVGRVASSILNTDELVASIVNLISDRFGFYYAAIFLIDEEGKWAVLKDATGDAGQELKARGHRLEIGGRSMVGSAINSQKGRIALDVGAEAVRFDNPLLPETRSEIALPLIVGNSVLGALDVQSTEGGAFKSEDIDTLQTLANQVAIAIENANLFERTQKAAETQQRMNQFSARIQAAPDVDGVLATAVTELARLMDAAEVTIRLAGSPESAGTTNGAGAVQERDHSNGRE